MKIKIFTTIIAITTLFGTIVPAQKSISRKVQRVRVNLTEKGYEPESFRLSKGVLAYVTFTRKTASDCGEVIVIPAYGVHRDLPLNRPVTVKFTPRRTGTFNFTCGMDMLRGQIMVN